MSKSDEINPQYLSISSWKQRYPSSLLEFLNNNKEWNSIIEKYPDYFQSIQSRLKGGLEMCNDLSSFKDELPEVLDILKKECDNIFKLYSKFKSNLTTVWNLHHLSIPNFPKCKLGDCSLAKEEYLRKKNYITMQGCNVNDIFEYCQEEEKKILSHFSEDRYQILDSDELEKIQQIILRIKNDPNFLQDTSLFSYNLNYSETKMQDIFKIFNQINIEKGEINLDLSKTRNNLIDSVSLIYILTKSQESDKICISNYNIFPIEMTKKNHITNFQLIYDLEVEEINYSPSLIQFLIESLNNNNCRFIVIPLVIIKLYARIAHANLILIDKEQKTIERFEPHGYGSSYFSEDDEEYYSWEENIKRIDKANETLEKKLLEFLIYSEVKLPDDYKYYGTLQACPISGFQTLESMQKHIDKETKKGYDLKGYCLFWTYFYLEMRLRFPDFRRDELMEVIHQIFTFSEQTYYNFIRHYTNRLFEISQLIIKDCLEDKVTNLIELMECISKKDF